MTLKFYISLVGILLTTISFSQEQTVEFTSAVSKNKLGVNQRLRIEYKINKQGGDNFKSPNFKNFKVVGGPSQSVSQSWVNGKVTFSQSYTYIIEPKRKGEFLLPAASIEINGNQLKTEPIKIIVTDAVDTPKNPNDPNYIADQNIHLVAEVSKAQPYVGEGIYVEYRIYFSNSIAIYDYAVTEAPQYNGFWNQEIKRSGMPVKTTMYNGEQYRYAVLHKALLIPTKAGKLTIDPMKMDIVVAIPTGRGDFFGNPITKKVRKEFASAKKTIRPKQLPELGKPEGFKGAVGDFSYSVNANKNSLKANESSEIKVTVEGKGNLKLFEIPSIITPKELEVYQPERNENVSITSSGLKGTITDNYTVVPQYKGKYKIPNTEFSYFNPSDESYHTITTEDLYVNVISGKELMTPSNDTEITKTPVTSTGKNFRYIQNDTSFKSVDKQPFFNSTLFYLVLILPLLFIPVAIVIGKRKEAMENDILGNKIRKADKLARKYLSKAKTQLGHKDAFYEALEKALHNYLKSKLSIETTDISKDKITKLLTTKNVNVKDISDFMAVFDACDFARYTPTTNLQMEQEYEKAKRVITQLDKQL